MSAPSSTVTVRILGVPVELWARSQELSNDLMREFALIAIRDRPGERELPQRVTQVAQELTENYSHLGSAQEQQLTQAREAGLRYIDLVYELPPELGQVATEIGELLDEADEYCRQGGSLLTLAASPEVRAFRWWFLDEIRRQLDGKDPIEWRTSHWSADSSDSKYSSGLSNSNGSSDSDGAEPS